MLRTYLDVIELLGRVRRDYRKFIREELGLIKLEDIDHVEALILWNLGWDKTTTNEVRNRLNYTGSHLNMIIRKLNRTGYVCSERSCLDRREVEIWLKDRGRELCDRLSEIHNRVLGIPPDADLE
jgi:DNA-binding MarR family transcriptional regulator